MDIILEFKKLAAELQKDDRLIYLEQANKMNDMDQELQTLIAKFNLARANLNTAISSEDKDNDTISSLNVELNDLYGQIMTNDSMLAYNESRAEVEKLSQHIQAIIAAAFNGTDPMTVELPEEGCSGSCSSCSGCN